MASVNNARRARFVAAALACSVLLVACAGDDLDSSASEQTQPGSAEQPTAESTPNSQPELIDAATRDTSPASESADSSAAPDTTVARREDQDPSQPLGLDDAARLLAIEATVGVQVDNVGEATSKIVDLATARGGQVYGSDIDLSQSELAGGSIVVKVPPVELENLIDDLATVGDVVSRAQDTEDVTEQVADLDVRILNASASVERLRQLVADTADLNQLVFLEDELSTRQLELEQLLAARDNVVDRAALSTLTINVSLRPVVDEAVAVATEPEPEEERTVGDAFRSGWDGFVKAMTAVLVLIGLSAPFLVVGAIVLIALRWVLRRPTPAGPRSRSAVPPPPPAAVADPHSSVPSSAGAARTE
jgi:hypothetical protein